MAKENKAAETANKEVVEVVTPTENTGIEVVEVSENKPVKDMVEEVSIVEDNKSSVTKVKVKFVENHTFGINTETFKFKKGDITSLEKGVAMKLVNRNLAYIM